LTGRVAMQTPRHAGPAPAPVAPDPDGPVAELIAELHDGTPEALHRLMPLVYAELHRLARRHLRNERADHTLCTTSLVHDACVRLLESPRIPAHGRAQFFAIASRAMRQVLIDHARSRRAVKRGGTWRRIPLEAAEIAVDDRADALIALDEALTRLAALSERLANVVECRYFGGLSEEETAAALGVTARTVRRDWAKARLWLYDQLREPDDVSERSRR
jgi:RNA polymerase sigma factor (TIGR02999 family)